MSDAMLAPAVPWGDRTELLPKTMSYVVSLDLTAETRGGRYLVVRGSAPDTCPLRHLFDETVVTMPEGLRCDLPSGRVLGGDGEIGAASDPESTSLRLRVTAEVAAGVQLNIDCLGTVGILGGASLLRGDQVKDLTGTAFVATRQEILSATHRWMNRRQLFGVGRVEATLLPSREWALVFHFDLYAAA